MVKCNFLCVLCCYLVFGWFVVPKDFVAAQRINSPDKDFKRHSIVTPTVHHARTKRELSSTKNPQNNLHHPELTLTIPVEDQQYILDLRLNEDLVAADHTLGYHENGKTVYKKPTAEELNICQYHGKIRGKPDSWAAVSTCRGVQGVLHDGVTIKYIQPVARDADVQSEHYLYDATDYHSSGSCGHKDLEINPHFDHELAGRIHAKKMVKESRPGRYKRSEESTEIRGPWNSNKKSLYVELALVADYEIFMANDQDVYAVHHKLKDIANIVNAMYAPLKIFIALVGVEVWTERNEIILTEDDNATLYRFLQYREQRLNLNIHNDNAHLITNQKFTKNVVGKAIVGPMCTQTLSGGIAVNHSPNIGLVAATVAHEMGHNFGMSHDTKEACTCPEEICIMYNSSTSFVPTSWSSCSLMSLAVTFSRGMDFCLRNKPTRLFDSPTCGNGFVEAGEQCDCGASRGVAGYDMAACTRCCTEDCTLRSNATCATGQCCDLQTCRPKSAGTECRAAARYCDLPEYCTGSSEYCPPDIHKMDALPCPDNESYCMKGSCRSRTGQCRLLWGSTGESSPQVCYTRFNTQGIEGGNCGYDSTLKVYKKCAQSDVTCGLLHCRHLNEQLQFGMDGYSVLRSSFLTDKNGIIPCRTAIIDMGLNQVDPGMVPDGASCGDDKICYMQRCVAVESVRNMIKDKNNSVCPSNCSGHGVCNSLGECHCAVGFSPPLCALPGPGGSYSSGPASDPTLQRNFMIAMYVIFLGIIPSILLLLFLIYYSKHNVLPFWSKPKKTIPSPKKQSLQERISRSASKFASNFHGPNGSGGSASVNINTVTSPDDMSSSLLRSDSDRSPNGQLNPTVNFFGNFKGFSLAPIDKNEPNAEQTAENRNDNRAKITPVHRNSSATVKPALRTAPPLPVVPVTTNVSPKPSPSVKRTQSVQNKIKNLMNVDKSADVTPPPTQPRPVISSPILEASTCTAKELISPLQGSKTLKPIRTAPGLPTSPELPKRPLSMHAPGNVQEKPLPEEPKKGLSLNRIASFLKQEKPKEKVRSPVERSHSLPKNPNHQVKIPKNVDKAALRNLQISNPILQKDIELSVATVPVVSDSEDADDPKAFVNRTQSMRGPQISNKPVMHSFGSMRQPPGVTRPVSSAGRPTAPPPPLPETNIYQNPKLRPEIKPTDYVDCVEEKSAPLAHIDEESADNIYAVIEESPEKQPKVPKPVKAQEPAEAYNTPRPITSLYSGSTESMGLLGEIVTEMQNRNVQNVESIYSAATLLRKKKEKGQNDNNRDSTYMNTDYKGAESVYSNSGARSTASTTSSGYLHPSAVNVPNLANNETKPKETDEKAPPSPTMKINSKIPQFSRQVTPPGLKTTSTFRNVPSSPKNTPKSLTTRPLSANSPDLVSSCATAEPQNAKPPDVINNNNKSTEPPKIAAKPVKLNDNARPPIKPATVDKRNLKATPSLKPTNSTAANTQTKTQIEKNPPINRVNSKVDSNVKSIADNINKNKPKVVPKLPSTNVQKSDTNLKPAGTKLTAKPSNVASLQQKFENRKSLGRESAAVKKS